MDGSFPLLALTWSLNTHTQRTQNRNGAAQSSKVCLQVKRGDYDLTPDSEVQCVPSGALGVVLSITAFVPR